MTLSAGMKSLFTVLVSLFLVIYISCDTNEKKINGDILLTILDNERTSTQIYRMTEDGELTKLTPFDDAESYNGRWSPDGTKIVFQTTKRSTTRGSSLYIMNSDGSHPKPIKEIDLGYGETMPLFGASPAWSPDGKKIVYDNCDCEVGGYSNIFAVDMVTKQVTQLTNNNYPDGFPLWYPDGSKILFESSNRDSISGSELYSMNPDGSNQTQITFNRGRAAAWSNTDSLLAYFSRNDTSVHIFNIKTMADAKRIHISLTGEILNPTMTWSAANSSILFITVSTDGYDRHHLYRLDLQDHSITRLLETYDYVMYVDWLKR